MSVSQSFVVTVHSDGRFASKEGTRLLSSLIGDRIHRMDGVTATTCDVIGVDRLVVSVVEYEQLRNQIDHLETTIASLKSTPS